MFNAQPSDHAGQEFDVLVSCGHRMLQDDLILDTIKHQCLICQRTFYMPGALALHLQQHDYKQLNTLWCLRRLQLTCTPCPCCGSDSSSDSTDCPALRNLAVLLTNGRRPRQGEFDLGLPFDTDPARKSRNFPGDGGQAQQKAKAQRQCINNWFDRRSNEEHDEADGSHHSQTRRFDSHASSRISVCDVSPTRGRKLTSCPPGLPSNLAERRSHPILAPHDGPLCNGDGQDSPRQIEECASQRRCGSGLHPLQPHRLQPADAVSEVGCERPEIGAEQGEAAANWRGESDHRHHCPDLAIGARDHSSIPCPVQAPSGGCQWENNFLSMGGGKSNAGRTVESLANSVISQHLATCEIDVAPTNSAEDRTCTAAGTDVVDDRPKHLVRILENDSSTMCYVNAALQALAWCTLLCQGLHPHLWAHGFELLRGLCQWNPIPLNLRVFQPFLWLLFGAFTEQDLMTQQDILEFTAFILERLAPTFLSCQWCTRFQFVTKVSHPILDSEKGERSAPILIRFIDFTATQCDLDVLLHTWHDPSGLCRASDQACSCIVLIFDRHIEGQNRKCTQRINIHSNIISFPCFANPLGEIQMMPFHLVAVTYHLGLSPNSGHHRATLRYQGHWLSYDDNRLPDSISELTDEILCNATMLWLVQPNATAVRTLAHRQSLAPSASSAADTGDSARPPAALEDDLRPEASDGVTEPLPKRSRTDSKD